MIENKMRIIKELEFMLDDINAMSKIVEERVDRMNLSHETSYRNLFENETLQIKLKVRELLIKMEKAL